MKATFTCLAMVLYSASLFAQETPATTTAESQPVVAAVTPAAKEKKPIVSFAASLGGTVLGGTLVVLSVDSFLDANVDQGKAVGIIGLLVLSAGPSAGHLYAGNLNHAIVFSGARLATAGIFLLGSKASLNGALDGDFVKAATGNAIVTIAGVGLVTMALYDIADSPFAVKRKKEEVLSVKISPAPILTADKSVVPGMVVSASFK